MCLITIAYKQHERFPVVVVGNRDEFFDRPASTAHWWESNDGLLAGQDLRSNGTWLGVHKQGRFAVVTNYRASEVASAGKSRGGLVSEFLGAEKSITALQYLKSLRAEADQYAGFNLLVADASGLFYFSNRENVIKSLPPGIYGLSNHLLDTPWPKLEKAKDLLQTALQKGDYESGPDHEFLIQGMQNTTSVPDQMLPSTNIPISAEKALSKVFVQLPGVAYGTRTITSVWIDRLCEGYFCEQDFRLDRSTAPEKIVEAKLSCFEFDTYWNFSQ